MEQRADGGRMRLGAVLVAFSFGFSVGTALAGWTWFPTGWRGDLARIPPTPLNYVALLLPWVTLLGLSVFHRLRRPIRTGDAD